MLASDLNNPEFAGAANPDTKLAARFYSRPVQNMFETQKQGRPIFEDRDYVEIFVPGDATNIINTPIREEHKVRFPLQWAHYQNQGGGRKDVGTPITQWPLISQSMSEELKAIKFFTVESIAFASDQQLQSIGMIAGMNPMSLREKAKSFLSFAKDSSVVQKQAEKIEQQDKLLAELNEKISKLMEMQGRQSQDADQEVKPKRKYTKKADNGDDAESSPASL